MATTNAVPIMQHVSDETVINATGQTWKEWLVYLDKHKAENLSHKEIVALLARKISSGWWCQKLTVAYEQYKGKRVLGQTATSGFQMGVSRKVPLTKDAAWDLISSVKGMAIWLGKLKSNNSDKQKGYTTTQDIQGEFTVITPGSHFRLSWQPRNWEKKSTLQVRVMPSGKQATISFHHEGLPSAAERENMKVYWKEKMDELMEMIAKEMPEKKEGVRKTAVAKTKNPKSSVKKATPKTGKKVAAKVRKQAGARKSS